MGKELSNEEVKRYFAVLVSVILIVVGIVSALIIYKSSKTIEVDLKIGESYTIANVFPDEGVDMTKPDGIVTYSIVSKDNDGLTTFNITAEQKGKVTIKVEDEEGTGYKYSVRVKE